MLKIFDIFTMKQRKFLVKEKDLNEVLNMVDGALFVSYIGKYRINGITIGNRRLAAETDLWYIHVKLTNNQWHVLLKECKNKKYQLVIKEEPENMYFTKMEESE